CGVDPRRSGPARAPSTRTGASGCASAAVDHSGGGPSRPAASGRSRSACNGSPRAPTDGGGVSGGSSALVELAAALIELALAQAELPAPQLLLTPVELGLPDVEIGALVTRGGATGRRRRRQLAGLVASRHRALLGLPLLEDPVELGRAPVGDGRVGAGSEPGAVLDAERPPARRGIGRAGPPPSVLGAPEQEPG